MSDIKLQLTDLPTSIRLKELGVEQNERIFYYSGWGGLPVIQIIAVGETANCAMTVLDRNDWLGYIAAFTLSEILELIDWDIFTLLTPSYLDYKWQLYVPVSDDNFIGQTLLEAASKALIYQLENKK